MKQTSKLSKSILSVALGAAISATAQAAPLEKELRVLLDTHPILKAAAYTVDSAEADVKSAEAGYFPRAFVDAGVGQEYVKTTPWDDPENARNNTAAGDPNESYTTFNNGSLRIEQPLAHFGRIRGAVDVADSALDQASYREAQTTQDVILEGITTYLQVARFVTLIQLAEQNEKSTREQLELESKRVERGGGIQVDALQAKTRLQVVRERSVFYNQQLRDVLASYEQLFGHSADLSSIQAVGIPESLLPTAVDSALEEYLPTNPSVQAAFASADQAFAQLDVIESGMLPKLDLVARANAEEKKGGSSAKREYSLGLRFSWNFSLGGKELHDASSTLASHDAAYQRALAARNSFKQQVRVNWNQLENGKERLSLLEDAVEISKSVMNDRKRLRDAGKETALAVLDAEVEYYGVLANKVNAEFDTRIAAYRLLAALGALSPQNIGISTGSFALPVSSLVTAAEKL